MGKERPTPEPPPKETDMRIEAVTIGRRREMPALEKRKRLLRTPSKETILGF